MDDLNSIPVDGSLKAPIIYFDGVPVHGVGPGIGRVAIETLIQEPGPSGTVKTRRVIVAHLRGNALAFAALREAINGMEAMLAGPKDGDQVN